jgi:hypothetical protein
MGQRRYELKSKQGLSCPKHDPRFREQLFDLFADRCLAL